MTMLLVACSEQETAQGKLTLKGVWVLQSKQFWTDEEVSYTRDADTWLRIYDDSCYYECRVLKAPSGKMFQPSLTEHYTLIERGPSEYLYLQDDNTYPLDITSDSTITIQEMGSKYTWRVCHDYDEETVSKIANIIRNDTKDDDETQHRYVFSYAERQLQTFSHQLIYSLAIALLAGMLVLCVAYFQYRDKKRVKQQLHQLEQERKAMPEPVREAMNTVEEDFHQSDFYLSLRQKTARGERLSKQDWKEIEDQLAHVYPRFTTTLLTLHGMSPTELQVCQLLKLRVPPSEIATALCKDKSSISSIRSRLYGKVFGRKGTGREWDEFILSL